MRLRWEMFRDKDLQGVEDFEIRTGDFVAYGKQPTRPVAAIVFRMPDDEDLNDRSGRWHYYFFMNGMWQFCAHYPNLHLALYRAERNTAVLWG